MSGIILFGKYDWFDCNIINVFQRFEKQYCETSIASSNVPISKVSKNRTLKVLVSLVGSPCFNIEKICVSIYLFIQAKVLKMWKTATGRLANIHTHFSGTRNSENTISSPRWFTMYHAIPK